ncbi:MAG: hypothetical protein Cons2KO_23590 [Congregibacter sp.]
MISGASLLANLRSLVNRAVSLSAVLMLMVLAGFAVEALRGLRVERIVVTGKLEHLRQAAVREALAGNLDEGLVFLQLDALREELEALPWVYRAALRRRYPDTLEVHVVEQLPIARWGEQGFLNHEARITTVADAQRWQELPMIRGPQGSQARLMSRYQRLLEQLGPLSLTPVVVAEDDFGQLRVELDNGLELQLGDREFTERVRRFKQLWRNELERSPQHVMRVDMRYDSGAAVALAETAQLAAVASDSQGR